MSQIVPFHLRIEQNVVSRIVRKLNGKGSFNVSKGQEIAPYEIIGTAAAEAGFRIINLAAELHTNPQESAKYLTKNLNQCIYKGELLAIKKGGLLGGKKILLSPCDGILESFNPKTGELKFSFLPKKINLPAGVYGIVEEVNSERGEAIIRTQVSRIYGVFGTGKPRDGILHILGKRDEIIAKERIEPLYNEHILVGGSLFLKNGFSSAISNGVKGLISGGINASDYRAMAGGHLEFPKKIDNDIGISIVVCEGFGAVPVSPDIFNFLTQYEGKFVFIDGNKGLVSLPSFSSASIVRVRNTILPAVPEDFTAATELKIGMKVRVIGNSYFSEQGTVAAINNSPTLLPSKIKSILAVIETATRKIEVPVANLEAVV